MKTAKEWQKEFAGETSVESIRRIQADALLHAVQVIGDYPRHKADSIIANLALHLLDEVNHPE